MSHTLLILSNWLWVLLGVLWLIAAPQAKKIVYQESVMAWMVQMIAFLVALLLITVVPTGPAWFNTPAFHVPWPLDCLGALIAGAGIVFCASARIALGRNWSSSAAIKLDHRLIRTGPYSIVRHPIYSGLALALIGSAIEQGLVRGLIGVAICLAGFWSRILVEEKYMRMEFETEYVDYCRSVRALIPYVW